MSVADALKDVVGVTTPHETEIGYELEQRMAETLNKWLEKHDNTSPETASVAMGVLVKMVATYIGGNYEMQHWNDAVRFSANAIMVYLADAADPSQVKGNA